MKILGISGGTKNGSNDAMCREALMGAKEAGAEVEFIRLHDLDIRHCTGCKACVMGLFSGRGNACVIKDDFQWLVDRMYDADGIVFAIPIFEKCAPGIFHTVMDRFGPRLDRGNCMIGTKIAEQGGKPIDPKYLKEKVVSYMGIGGSDWATRIECDFMTQALTPKWTLIDKALFKWSLDIVMNDEAVTRAHELGKNTAVAAKKMLDGALDIPHGIVGKDYVGEKGVCPYCQSNNFYLQPDGKAICCLCGMEGRIEVKDGKYNFIFPEEMIPHAHDSISGKFIHGDDIQRNEGKVGASKKTDEYKARVDKYKSFISGSVPEK